MKVPISWLREFVEVEEDPYKLGEILTLGGIEVEEVQEVGPSFKGVIIGKVLRVWDHPNATKLKLCEVIDGERSFRVVCGAPNLQEGQKVAFAPPGALLPKMQIEARKIRGELSEGMICSEAELELSEDSSGIMVLSEEAPLGGDLAEYLGLKDYILEVSPTPNRGDCLSVFGIAREIAALKGIPLKEPTIDLKEEEVDVKEFIRVEIEAPEHCPRYTARYLFEVKVGPSPLWMRLRLSRCGMRPINNVVDITNYVMLELGQPLHAFDYDKLRGKKIVVKLAKDGDRFTTLDGKQRVLDGQTLMICDAEGPVAIGGIMGGLESEIEEGTKRVLLESAYFSPESIRRSVRFLDLNTEASLRFSRGVDPELSPLASARAASLMTKYAGAKLAKGIVDVYVKPLSRDRILMDLNWAEDFLGLKVSEEEFLNYLKRLGMEVQKTSERKFYVIPPSFRFDLKREVDIAEEIARLKGYENIPETLPQLLPLPKESKSRDLEKRLKEIMVGFGFYEVITYSFLSPRSLQAFGFSRFLKLLNPLSEEMSLMRPSLIPGLVEVARFNANRGIKDLRIFELRKVFLPQDDKLPKEEKRLGVLLMGEFYPSWWQKKGEKGDFFILKGCLEGIFKEVGVLEKVSFAPVQLPYLHPFQGAQVELEGIKIGVLGRLNPDLEDLLELKEVYIAELSLEMLFGTLKEVKTFKPLPKFPGTFRDISVLVEEEVLVQELLEVLKTSDLPHLEGMDIIDCYTGPPLPTGKKNITVRLFLRVPERTITDDEADLALKKAIEAIKKAGWSIRE